MGDAEPQVQFEAVSDRIDELSRDLAELRELVKRAYEATPLFTARLMEIRRSPAYEKAFEANPLVTVRIGTYGSREELFDRAMRSVIAQTYPRWEAIVACDGPAPDTVRRVAKLREARIRCFERPRNGPYPTDPVARWQVVGAHPFNDAVAEASGSWIAPIDDDDEWTDDHLEVLLGRAQATRAELVYGVFRAFVADLGETWFGAWPPEMGDFGFQAAIYHAGLCDFAYDANAYRVGEPADWNVARRMLEAGVRFDFVDQVVGNYYVEAGYHGLTWWTDRLRSRGAFAPSRASSDSSFSR